MERAFPFYGTYAVLRHGKCFLFVVGVVVLAVSIILESFGGTTVCRDFD